ncbi:MAG TPA: RluA family pseudouridine synthase [Pseudobacteroides sp.]|nr:RluA family pseudouridine synthase [Pseudobacteroides sp.]
MEEIKLIADTKDLRIDSWISEKLPEHSRTYIKKLIDNEAVLVNGKKVKSNYKLKLNDEVLIHVPDPVKLDVEAEKIDMDIVYEDKDILVINKPKGMVVHPAAGNYSGTLVNGLMDYCGDELSDINGVIRPGIVHRIDKDTSGLLVVAKNNMAHEKFTDMLKAHEIKRVYYAVVDGVIREESGKIDAPIGRHPVDRKKMAVNTRNGRRAVTYFKVMERFKDATLVEVRLETGRTHQIRVHMSYIGYPVMGDEVYGRRSRKIDTKGQVLHAKILEFVHPVSGENMRFEVDLPDYFKEVLKICRE